MRTHVADLKRDGVLSAFPACWVVAESEAQRVNNTVKKSLFLEIPWGCVLIDAYVLHQSLCLSCFTRITPCYLCNYRVYFVEMACNMQSNVINIYFE